MAHGYIAGFVKHDGRWYGEWVRVERHRQKRIESLQAGVDELKDKLQAHAAGPTMTGLKMVVVDALCYDGREFLEALFETVKRLNGDS